MKILKLFLACLALGGISLFCEFQTKGFRFQQILSDLPSDPSWEVEAVGSEVEERLHQTFHYLGSGQQCDAFLGDDQKTVLKFFKHNDLSLKRFLHGLSPALEFWYWNKFQKSYDPREVFESCKLAFKELREPSGLLCVHLNKTEGAFPRVLLFDPIGVAHEIELDRTEFLVQEYGELAVARIDRLMRQGDTAGAEDCLKKLFGAIEGWSRQGIQIENPAIRRNIGFIDDRVILLDTGSLRKVESVPVDRQVKKVTHRLGRWIKKHHPKLYPAFSRLSYHDLEL